MKGRANRQKTVAEQMRSRGTRGVVRHDAAQRNRPAREERAWERRKKR